MIAGLADLQTVRFSEDGDGVVILDQTQLPEREVYVTLRTAEEIWEAIYRLKVRGAPAIGIAAAYGLSVCAEQITATEKGIFAQKLREVARYLSGSRPTAVNLSAALDRMLSVLDVHPDSTCEAWKKMLRHEATKIREEDAMACRMIGEHMLDRLRPGMGILTHCNAGHLAVSELGTALSPIYLGQERGYGFRVYADETRPLLQGARLTAYELRKAGVDVTLICDNMAASLMRKGCVDAVIVGCDRVAANGDVANKIGTFGLAILAHHFGIPFYVLGPTSTIDMSCPTGEAIVIEERAAEEVTEMWYAHRMAPEGISVYNPAFDVTPHELITAVITEKGAFYEKIISESFANPETISNFAAQFEDINN
ncbi:MAG: S-methyl-5-thioribose-1-phosphate isomerase [Parabacteroides sp.]|nr:S-methyl-5-thioribose-1-phosphate isomerase [Parabacteroides sp.]